MDKIIIEYQSQNDGQLSKMLLAAVMDVFKCSSAEQVYISQNKQQSGSRIMFTYRRGGLNGL